MKWEKVKFAEVCELIVDCPHATAKEEGPGSSDEGPSSQKSDLKKEKWPEKCVQILQIIHLKPSVTIPELEKQLGIGHTTIKKMLKGLQSEGMLRRVGPNNGRHWEILSPDQQTESNAQEETRSNTMKELGL